MDTIDSILQQEISLAAVTIRNLPDETHRALKLRAAQHGRSTEAEIRALLEEAVRPKVRLGTALRARAELGRRGAETRARSHPRGRRGSSMILLDTNVLSEPLKPAPSQAVLDWLDAQEPETLYLSTVSLAELLAGV
jgi:plasmid stability protein